MADIVKGKILRITILSIAAGVILFNQNLSYNVAKAGSVLSYIGTGLASSGIAPDQGVVETINYYAGLAPKKDYSGFENVAISPDSEAASQDVLTDDEALVIINNDALFGFAGFYDQAPNAERKSIITYEIKPGDTPSYIAEMFGISTNTLLWANNLDLSSATRIKPGDKLVILPVSGIRHVVKKGETVAAIAKKYSADQEKILSFNGLKAGEGLEIDSVLIVPAGKMPVPPAPKKPRVTLAMARAANTDLAKINEINTVAGDLTAPAEGRRFPWGQCTYYVALRRYIPWNGHAKNWLANARAYGYKTGKIPVVGAIVSTTENPRYGHVAYVEEVNDDKITISEMNYIGLGIKSVRILSVNSPVIRGYIYDKE